MLVAEQRREVRVRVDVDEAGGDVRPGGVDPFVRVRLAEVSDRCDATVADPDVGGERLAAGPVDDEPSGDDGVEALGQERRGQPVTGSATSARP